MRIKNCIFDIFIDAARKFNMILHIKAILIVWKRNIKKAVGL